LISETKHGRRYEWYLAKISNRSEALENLYEGADISTAYKTTGENIKFPSQTFHIITNNEAV
jgi:hypothetical protein